MILDVGFGNPKPGISKVLLLVVTLASVLAAGGISHAQAEQGRLVVDAQDAESHFPDTIRFTLKAHGFEARSAILSYKLAGQRTTRDLDAKVTGGASSLTADVDLDLSKHYIPPGAEVSYYWFLSTESGEPVTTPTKTFTLLDQRFAWKSLTDSEKRVTVHWYGGSDKFGQTLITTASSALNRIEKKLDARLTRPVNVWVYTREVDFHWALSADSLEWVGGEAFSSLSLALVLITNPESVSVEEQISSSVPHELTHLLLYQAVDNPDSEFPAWLNEGLAMRNQEAHDLRAEYEPLKDAAHEGRLIPLSDLSAAFESPDSDRAGLAYAESQSVVSFILDDKRYGAEKMKHTIAAFHSPVGEEVGIENGLGVTVEELDKEWQASLPFSAPDASRASAQGETYASSLGSRLFSGCFNPMIGCLLAVAFIGLVWMVGRRNRARRRRTLKEELEL